jgi:hypothetical protein
MHFGLLISDLPRVEESRIHHDAMLSQETREPRGFSAFCQRLKSLFS